MNNGRVILMDLLDNEVELVTKLCKRLKAEQAKRKSGITMKLLDIGCGTGKLALYLRAETDCEVTGIDPVQANIEKARLKSSSVRFVVASAEQMPFANETFDVAVSLKALHEIPNPQEALKESHRVLKTGGKLFIVDWIGNVPQTSTHGHANTYFTMQRLKEALYQTGFTNVTIKPNKEGKLMIGEGADIR